MQLNITDHAYERYCERVEPVKREDLQQDLESKINQPERKKHQYIKLDGVWWRFGVEGKTMRLFTCYGRHNMDLPAAIKWAKRFKDRIALGDDDE
jgi:hypothetical protein